MFVLLVWIKGNKDQSINQINEADWRVNDNWILYFLSSRDKTKTAESQGMTVEPYHVTLHFFHLYTYSVYHPTYYQLELISRTNFPLLFKFDSKFILLPPELHSSDRYTIFTMHDTCDVVPSVQFCGNMIPYNGVALKPIFHRSWIINFNLRRGWTEWILNLCTEVLTRMDLNVCTVVMIHNDTYTLHRVDRVR